MELLSGLDAAGAGGERTVGAGGETRECARPPSPPFGGRPTVGVGAGGGSDAGAAAEGSGCGPGASAGGTRAGRLTRIEAIARLSSGGGAGLAMTGETAACPFEDAPAAGRAPFIWPANEIPIPTAMASAAPAANPHRLPPSPVDDFPVAEIIVPAGPIVADEFSERAC